MYSKFMVPPQTEKRGVVTKMVIAKKVVLRVPESNRHVQKGRGILSPLRLPIPPHEHGSKNKEVVDHIREGAFITSRI